MFLKRVVEFGGRATVKIRHPHLDSFGLKK